jgi:hypothetical protein
MAVIPGRLARVRLPTFSQGGGASGWAASLAPSYAPELNLCGSEVSVLCGQVRSLGLDDAGDSRSKPGSPSLQGPTRLR